MIVGRRRSAEEERVGRPSNSSVDLQREMKRRPMQWLQRQMRSELEAGA